MHIRQQCKTRYNSNCINYKHFAKMKGTIYGNRLPWGTQVQKKSLGITGLVGAELIDRRTGNPDWG